MALTSSINNAIYSSSKFVSGTGEFRGKVLPSGIRASHTGSTPFKITGVSLYLAGANSAVSTAIGIETASTSFFQVAHGSQSNIPETQTRDISYTFLTSPSSFDIKVYANGLVYAGANDYSGINIELGTTVGENWTPYSTFSNKSFVGRYEYIQVPSAPKVSLVDSITSSSMRVNIEPSNDIGGGILSGYQIQIATSANFSTGLRIFNITSTSHTITNLDANKTYFIRVLSKNELWSEASAGSPWSTTEAATTLQDRTSASSGKGEAFFRYTEPSASNLYSEKVFAEHPLALWSLDDKSDYLSLISEENRDLTNWSVSGGAASSNDLLPVVNTFTNPSFETSDGNLEIARNLITNPSFEADAGAQEIWRNVYPNPTFSEGAQLNTFTTIRINYITNPNFETNASGWTGTPAVTRQTSQIWNGTASGQVAWTALNQTLESNIMNDLGIATVSAYIRGVSGAQTGIAVRYVDKGGNTATYNLQTFTTNGSWQRISAFITTPNQNSGWPYGPGPIAFYLQFVNKTSGSNTIQIDGVMVEQGHVLREYFDGNGSGNIQSDPDFTYSWSGTVNGSSSSISGRDLANTTNLGNAVGYQSSTWGVSTPGGIASRSLRITPKLTNDSYTDLTGIILKPNTTYTALGTIRLISIQNNPHEFARKFRAWVGQQEVSFTYIEEAPNTIGEHIVRATFETTSDATLNNFQLYNGDDSTDVWWDNVIIVEGVYLGGYFDGRTSPDSDLIPAFETVGGVVQSKLSGLVPAGQSFSIENGKAILSSKWSSGGTKSLKIISTSKTSPARYYTTLGNLGLQQGKTYTALIKAYLDVPQTGTLYDFPNIDSKFSFSQLNNTAGVQSTRIVFTIDGIDVTLNDEISLYNRATVGNGDVWWDDFMLIEGDYSGDYFDGSSVSSDPDITISWQGTPNISQSFKYSTKVASITNGYQSSVWSASGQYSLRIPDGQTSVIPISEESTVIITGRNIGQSIITNNGVVALSNTDQEITLYGVTSLTLESGWWDNLCIVPGIFTLGYFDGSNDIADYYSTSWSGIENASTSLAQPLISKIFSIGVTDPFKDSATSVVNASTGSTEIRLVSPIFASWLDINDYLSSMSIGMFVASDNDNLISVDLGYTDGEEEFLQSFDINSANQWSYISSQFSSMPDEKSYQIVLVFNMRDTVTETNILVNGITAGQWGEEFQLTSLGVQKVEIPAEIGIAEFFGVEANAYGLQDSNGYYVINDNLLLARNIGMPMVYGANNISSLSPNPDGGPSLIIPGKGFLNDLGRYRDYTVEFWMRANVGSSEPRRIFGPLHSDDGVYVDGPFITLKVGEYVGSHYISEWYRPMLVDIVYGKNVIRLMVDGEVVVSIPITASILELPLGTLDGIDQDWLGFYAHDDVPQVEVDSFSIYSYQVPQLVAKRRFIYGQGVEFPETMNVSFNGKSVLVDHTFADYTNSYRYPDLGKWIQGISENVSVKNNVLSTPEYSLPKVVFNKQTESAWYQDLSAVGDQLIDSITLKPNQSWQDVEGYMLFESLNIVKQDIKAFYGIFNVDGSKITDEVLFKVEDDATKNYLLITVSGDLFNGYDIKYTIRYGANAEPEVLLVDHILTTNETLFVGIDIDRFARKYGRNLLSFFGSPRRLKVYAAGTKEFNNTFSGNITRIGFCTRRNFAKISSLFGINGIIIPDAYDAGDKYFGNNPDIWDRAIDGGEPATMFFESSLKNHVASYTLFAKKYYDVFKLDIATDSYWEDYIPLSYLGKEVLDENGDTSYGLDFIQFNIDYPRPIDTFNGYYDTANSLLKTYVSFQYISTGANQVAASFDKVIPANKNNVVDPNTMIADNESWLNKKFEVVNNMIIYPPEGVDFKKLALVIHVEFVTQGILSKSVKIKNLQISSKAFNKKQPNKIGTRLGQPVYPYSKYGIYYDYEAKNPYTIYRGSTPYLYLTKDSGIKLVGDIQSGFNRGLSITVNPDRSSRYRLTAIQGAMLFPNDDFPTIPTPVFELDTNTGTISFFVISSHPNRKRGTIYAIDKATGREFSDALFFLNGRFVKTPTISLNEWNMLAVAFMNNIALDGKAGAIRVNGPMIFNNLSFYEETALQQARQASLRQWFGVRYSGNNDLLWNYWTPYSWEDVLVLSPNDYDGVNPVELYSTYSGTNKIVVGDDTKLSINGYKYKVYQDVVSTPFVVTPL